MSTDEAGDRGDGDGTDPVEPDDAENADLARPVGGTVTAGLLEQLGTAHGVLGVQIEALFAHGQSSLVAQVARTIGTGSSLERISGLVTAGLRNDFASIAGAVMKAAGPSPQWLSGVLEPFTKTYSSVVGPGLLHGLWQKLASDLERHRASALSPNLARLRELTAGDVRRLAEEGLTLWAVPRASIACRLIGAATPTARRRVLGDQWQPILDDCATVVAIASGGPYGSEVRSLEQAIHAVRDGHVAAGQALVATVLDSTRVKFASRHTQFGRLTNHHHARAMDHFAELSLADAMVWAPIHFAYRPQRTPAERAAHCGFARHATAHTVSFRQMNRRNAVQGAMLAASLIDFASLRHDQEERVRLAA